MRKTVMLGLAGAALALSLAIPGVAAEKSAAVRSAWPPETLSGKIDMVEPGQKIIVVQTVDKVPYDLVVTPKTRIMVGDQVVALKDLKQYQNKYVTVQFVPEGRGDMARTIRING
jgi:hypothetical protein